MLQKLFDTFEELKKYVFIVNRGSKKPIIIKFKDEHFYHLVGLHKLNIDMFFPEYIKTKARKYSYMKKKVKKFDNIINNQKQEKNTVDFRIETFSRILSLLKDNDIAYLYDLKTVPKGSLYKGDYGLLKIYESLNCLLGLKCENETPEVINCVPQSWMADTRVLQITEFKKPLYIENILAIPIAFYDSEHNTICI